MSRSLPQEPLPGAGAASLADLARLYDEHAADVERWVQRLFGPGADVPDLVHDIFLIAHRRFPYFRGEATVRTWLFRITARVVQKRRRKLALRRWFTLDGETAAVIAADGPTPAETAEERQRARRLYAALDRLPEKYRTALVLYEIEGLAGEEVARLVGVEVGALWVRLHRGRAKLGKALGGEEAKRG